MLTHIDPSAVLLGACLVGFTGAFLQQGIGNLVVDVLLLEHLQVRELDLAVKVLKSCGLAKEEELVVDEAILEVVKLVDILHNFLTLSLYKVLDKRISANGNPKANVAVDNEGLGGEQGTDVCEGGISSEQALCGRVRLGRRDALEENLGIVFVIEGFEVFKHVPQLFANSLNIVTLFEPASAITGGLAPQDVKG
jgi:hypothetical protein